MFFLTTLSKSSKNTVNYMVLRELCPKRASQTDPKTEPRNFAGAGGRAWTEGSQHRTFDTNFCCTLSQTTASFGATGGWQFNGFLLLLPEYWFAYGKKIIILICHNTYTEVRVWLSPLVSVSGWCWVFLCMLTWKQILSGTMTSMKNLSMTSLVTVTSTDVDLALTLLGR